MLEPTQAELFEIVSQLGFAAYTPNSTREELLQAIAIAGVDEETIEAEVREQRGRDTPGRPT